MEHDRPNAEEEEDRPNAEEEEEEENPSVFETHRVV
jgi:hypothetical protein